MKTDTVIGQKFWRPRLIELTTIPNPDVAGGEPQKVYVDPTIITLIFRGMSSFTRVPKPDESPPEFNPHVECSLVCLSAGATSSIAVIESPEEVARRRDGALEIRATLKEVT